MKKWNKILLSSLVAVMLTAQPAWADAGVQLIGPGMTGEAVAQEYTSSPVVVAGTAAEAGTAEEVSTVVEAGAAEVGIAVEAGDTAEMQPAGPGTGPASEASSSPVIVAGQSAAETQSAGPAMDSGAAQGVDGATEQAAEEAQPEAGRVVDPTRPMVALTYDDGPQPSVGNRIMDCLAQYDGKATFFLVGERVPGFAAEVQRMAAEGHEIANHTQNHVYLSRTDAAGVQAQVAQCNATIQAASGVTPTLMRLPGGIHNETVRANTGMPMIQWNIDTLDWKHRNADMTVNTILSQVKDGDIILMHELYTPTADATERIVPELVNRGFQLVTVSEMAAAKGVGLQAGQIYAAFH